MAAPSRRPPKAQNLRGGLEPTPTRPTTPPASKPRQRRSHEARRGPGRCTAACDCPKCQGKARRWWPSYYVGDLHAGDAPPLPLSFECWLEGNADELAKLPDPQRPSKGEALDLGLRIRRPRGPAKPQPVMVAGCQRCGGLRAAGDRWCTRCFELVKGDIQQGFCAWPRKD